MACTTVEITPEPKSVLTIATVDAAALSVEPTAPSVIDVGPAEKSELSMMPAEQSVLTVTLQPQAVLTMSEVCSVSGGVIVVLAASDGPLRTRDGGYLLLNPETNPEES